VQYFIGGRTKMMVKRAAVGAEGFVLDHYNRAAIDHHLKVVGEPLLKALGPNPPYAVFSDSLEVFASDWTGDLLEQFRKRRGYDLTPYLPMLAADIGGKTGAVRCDWGKTLTELAEETYLKPVQDWARAHHTRFRSQTYGTPHVAFEQRAGRSARGRASELADVQPDAVGGLGEPSLRQAGDVFGNVDVAALARFPRHATRHEGRG
jgi:hypothetical protein